MKAEASQTAVLGARTGNTAPPLDSGLFRELDSIHRALFGQPAPVHLMDAYRKAHSVYPVLEESREVLAALIDRGVDLEAAEFAARRLEPTNPLTRRFRTVAYLAEVRSERLGDFIGRPTPLLKAFTVLALAVIRSAWKLGKGSIQRKKRP